MEGFGGGVGGDGDDADVEIIIVIVIIMVIVVVVVMVLVVVRRCGWVGCGGGGRGEDTSSGFDTVEAWHPEIHEDDVNRRRVMQLHLSDGFEAVVCFVHHDSAAVVAISEFGEHVHEQLAVDLVVFCHEKGERMTASE